MSRGISFRPRAEQSTVVRSQWQTDGHSVSMRHSPAYRVRYSSLPARNSKFIRMCYVYVHFVQDIGWTNDRK